MSKINLFLQKIKMHESHHGIIMVISAYALSFLMLILGSDVFYNIKSAAAGISYEIEEETQEEVNQQEVSPHIMRAETLVLKSSLINPYGLEETSESEVLEKAARLALSGEANYSGQTDDISSTKTMKIDSTLTEIPKETKETEEAKESKKTKEETVKSLSVEEKAISVFSLVTNGEVEMLERIVEAEASGEDMVGKILIANVVFNRMADDEFPDSVEKVIFQKVDGSYQFSPISDKRFWTVSVSDETEEAVQRALEGEDYSEGALYFMSRKRAKHSATEWFDQELDWLFKHGGHEFYRNN